MYSLFTKWLWFYFQSEDSQSSSPSVSVTEIFIKRKVRCERKSPDNGKLINIFKLVCVPQILNINLESQCYPNIIFGLILSCFPISK